MAPNQLKQDSFTVQQIGQAIATGQIARGRYELDVGGDGECKLSLVQKRWVQKDDIKTE
jgi:hypothetical protein